MNVSGDLETIGAGVLTCAKGFQSKPTHSLFKVCCQYIYILSSQSQPDQVMQLSHNMDRVVQLFRWCCACDVTLQSVRWATGKAAWGCPTPTCMIQN